MNRLKNDIINNNAEWKTFQNFNQKDLEYQVWKLNTMQTALKNWGVLITKEELDLPNNDIMVDQNDEKKND